jgi:hypothetical protein
VKHTEKAIPTSANDFDLVSGVVTSEMIALPIPKLPHDQFWAAKAL